LQLARVDTDVENIAASEYDVSIVGCGRVAAVFGCALKYDVHVAVGLDHFAAVLHIMLQSNVDFGVQLLHEQIEGLSRRFQGCVTGLAWQIRGYSK